MATDSDDVFGTKWEGFSNYQRVSDRIAQSVYDAIEAYAVINSQHAENARVKPQMAAQARARILAPALRLKVEMSSERNQEEFADILDDWTGDAGYLSRLEDVQLQRQCPPFLTDFVEDIRSAGYQLGYLRAGRTVKEEPDDPTEADSERMFEDL